jgi:hypothetical protein
MIIAMVAIIHVVIIHAVIIHVVTNVAHNMQLLFNLAIPVNHVILNVIKNVTIKLTMMLATTIV